MGVGMWRLNPYGWGYPNVAAAPRSALQQAVVREEDPDKSELFEGGYGQIVVAETPAAMTGETQADWDAASGEKAALVIGVDPARPGSDITVDGNDGKVSDEPGK